ncbi:radical SAM protein [Corallococcus praedator]|uniref:Radical SAM protein n=1 Tax=Corallococcus praedator TaxID=2316724 RepID=A0ABX9QR27_9BACT|nr:MULTISPECIES: radical SAM protein [Corallococcus]RKH35259.1 radical SAM protein [Corallococcus sp. CA031C]RKI16410.1 radical SAM protein [Corallococcus praedator]
MISIYRSEAVVLRFYDDELAVLSRRDGARHLAHGPLVTVMRRLVESSGLDGLLRLVEGGSSDNAQQQAVIEAIRGVFAQFQQVSQPIPMGGLFKGAAGARLPKLSLQERIPLTGMCEITYRCNLRCQHCFVLHKIEEERPAHVDDETVLRMLRDLASMGCLDVSLTGGEATLHRGYQRFVTEAKSLHLYTVLKTNATTFTAQRARDYAKDPAHETHASLYGSTAEVHDEFTAVAGSLVKTMAGLRALADVGIRVKVNCTIWTRNTDQLAEMKQQMEELGHYIVFDDIIHGRLNGDRSPQALRISPLVRNQLVSNGWLKPFAPSPCGAGKMKVKIDAEGRIATCELFPGGFGNAHEASLPEVWAAPGFRDASDETMMLANSERDGDKVVRSCPGLNLLNTGQMAGRTTI